MKITFKGDYALKAVLELSLNYGKVLAINDLAKRLDIPIKFLEQVLLDLKKGGFVESRRGKIGGYILAKNPSQIKLGEVIRFIDGPIEPIGCVEKDYAKCKDIYRCVLREILCKIAEATSQIVDNITFEDLANKAKEAEETINYSI